MAKFADTPPRDEGGHPYRKRVAKWLQGTYRSIRGVLAQADLCQEKEDTSEVNTSFFATDTDGHSTVAQTPSMKGVRRPRLADSKRYSTTPSRNDPNQTGTSISIYHSALEGSQILPPRFPLPDISSISQAASDSTLKANDEEDLSTHWILPRNINSSNWTMDLSASMNASQSFADVSHSVNESYVTANGTFLPQPGMEPSISLQSLHSSSVNLNDRLVPASSERFLPDSLCKPQEDRPELRSEEDAQKLDSGLTETTPAEPLTEPVDQADTSDSAANSSHDRSHDSTQREAVSSSSLNQSVMSTDFSINQIMDQDSMPQPSFSQITFAQEPASQSILLDSSQLHQDTSSESAEPEVVDLLSESEEDENSVSSMGDENASIFSNVDAVVEDSLSEHSETYEGASGSEVYSRENSEQDPYESSNESELPESSFNAQYDLSMLSDEEVPPQSSITHHSNRSATNINQHLYRPTQASAGNPYDSSEWQRSALFRSSMPNFDEFHNSQEDEEDEEDQDEEDQDEEEQEEEDQDEEEQDEEEQDEEEKYHYSDEEDISETVPENDENNLFISRNNETDRPTFKEDLPDDHESDEESEESDSNNLESLADSAMANISRLVEMSQDDSLTEAGNGTVLIHSMIQDIIEEDHKGEPESGQQGPDLEHFDGSILPSDLNKSEEPTQASVVPEMDRCESEEPKPVSESNDADSSIASASFNYSHANFSGPEVGFNLFSPEYVSVIQPNTTVESVNVDEEDPEEPVVTPIEEKAADESVVEPSFYDTSTASARLDLGFDFSMTESPVFNRTFSSEPQTQSSQQPKLLVAEQSIDSSSDMVLQARRLISQSMLFQPQSVVLKSSYPLANSDLVNDLRKKISMSSLFSGVTNSEPTETISRSTETVVELETQPEAEAKTETEAKAETETETKAETKAEANAEAEAEISSTDAASEATHQTIEPSSAERAASIKRTRSSGESSARKKRHSAPTLPTTSKAKAKKAKPSPRRSQRLSKKKPEEDDDHSDIVVRRSRA